MLDPVGNSKSPNRAGISYFLRSPLQSHYFISNSALLFADLCLLATTVIMYRTRLSPLAFLFLGGVAFSLLAFWYRIFRVHSEIRELIRSGNLAVPEPGSVTDRAFGTVAALSFQALLNSFGIAMLCFMAVVE